jgi:hypothetical protein
MARDQIGAAAVLSRRRGFDSCHQLRLQGLHERVFDVLKSAHFHAFHDERFKLRSVNFYRHCGGQLLFMLAR